MKLRAHAARLLIAAIAGALLMSITSAQQPAPAEWFQWRGPNRDGISQETGLLQEWPKSGPPLAWRANGVGNGYSSFSTSGGRLYTLGARAGIEYVIALDRATGKKVWETQNGRRFENDRGDGPRSTPTVEGDRLYVLGGSGDLTCLENATGKKIWSINIVQKFGGVNPYWGYSESPLIVGDRILVNTGGRARGHRRGVEGRRLDALAAAQRRRRLFVADADAHRQPQPGDLLHRGSRRWPSIRATGDCCGRTTRRTTARRTSRRRSCAARSVFVSSDYGTGGALLDVRAAGNIATANEVYFTRDMRNHHASSVLVGDHLYGFSSSILTALKFDTGAMVWRDRSVGKGSLIFADNRLYLYSEDGVVGLAEASPAALPRARPLHASAAERAADVEPSDHRRRVADHSRSGHRLCLQRPGQVSRRMGTWYKLSLPSD